MNKCELSIDVTYNCPFSCAFCSSPQSGLPVSMNTGITCQCLNFIRDVFKAEKCIIGIMHGQSEKTLHCWAGLAYDAKMPQEGVSA